MGAISNLFNGVPGVRNDWKEDWKEESKTDWKLDWDAIPGDAPGAVPANLTLPAISGLAQVGETLTVSDGTWSGNPAPTITYQWMVDGNDVNGETSNSYVVQSADLGLMVGVKVTATNSLGAATETVTVGPVQSAP